MPVTINRLPQRDDWANDDRGQRVAMLDAQSSTQVRMTLAAGVNAHPA